MSLMRLISKVKSVCSLNRRREFKELLRRIAPTKQDSLLDIGSGDGYWTNQFALWAGRTVGLEPDPHALNLARSLHGRGITFQQGFAEKLPFDDSSFDCIVSVSCFEHFRDAQQALDECFRVLKPGGRLAISVDSLLPQNSRAQFRSWHSKKYFVTEYFGEQRLISMFTRSGLRPGQEPVTHLLNSQGSALIRELFLRNPVRWLPAFPALYSMVLYLDRRKPNMPGQVLVATAFKPPIPNTETQPRPTSHSPVQISSLPYANSLSSS
jgi:ubiquinone/menaquinone biosynthesis C-methylase UbiE